MKKERDSGIELLRIIAIFMVIGAHMWDFGKYFESTLNIDGVVQSSSWLFRIFVRSAVNIFLIISGYFTVHQSFDLKKSYKRVFRTYLSMFFYSVVLSVIALAAGTDTRAAMGVYLSEPVILAKMIFPLSNQTWYFLSDFVIVMLLAPFVNLTLTKITKKQYQILLSILGFLMSVWLFIGNLDIFKAIASTHGHDTVFAGKNVFSFIFMYIVGGYIGLHCKQSAKPKFRFLLLTVGCLLVNYLLFTRLDDAVGYKNVVISYGNPFVIMVSVFMFMFFKDLHFKSKLVNALASTTLGVYAIHDFWFIRGLIWDKIDFSKVDCTNIFKNIAMVFLGILAVFLCCAIIDLLRQKLFGLIENSHKKRIKTE